VKVSLSKTIELVGSVMAGLSAHQTDDAESLHPASTYRPQHNCEFMLYDPLLLDGLATTSCVACCRDCVCDAFAMWQERVYRTVFWNEWHKVDAENRARQ
jgi:hypothetical protein